VPDSSRRHHQVRSVVALLAAMVVVSACNGHSDSTTRGSVGSPSADASAQPTPPVAPPVRLAAQLAPWRLPAARSREVALTTDAGLLIAGGLSAVKVSTSSVWLLSARTGTTKQSAPLADGVHDATGVVLRGEPLVIAGGNSTTISSVQELTTTSTRVIGHLPQPRSDLVSATVAGSAYVLGGFDGTTSLSAVLRTTDGRHFTSVARLPVTVRYPAVAAVGDRLLVFGGEHEGVVVDDVQEVDLATGRARVVGHLARPLAHESAAALDGAVWLVGGRSGGRLQSRIWRWDPARHSAVAGGRLPYAVADAALARAGSTAYLLGGETPEPTARVVVLRAD
jgi:hypothetical protein